MNLGMGSAANASAESRTAEELGRIVGPEYVLTGPAAWRGYDCDAYTVDKFAPAAVVLPGSAADVQAIVKWCLANDVPFTARGAGTGLSGGALPALGGVLISTKRLTKILSVDHVNRTARVQAGATNKSVSDACIQYGLHFAPDPSSQLVSTIGGNIAENSGGPHTLKYGVTAGHLLELTMVDADGELRTFGHELEGAPGPNIVSLIAGSEGTLGIVIEALVKLTPLPTKVITSILAFPTVGNAAEAVSSVVAEGVIPAALELMDRRILDALSAAFGLESPPEAAALLLVECSGFDDHEVKQEMADVRRICEGCGGFDYKEAQDEAGRKRLWKARKQGIGAMGRLSPTIVTHDGVIPRSRLPEMLESVYKTAEEFRLGVANLFHAGDGNLHPCFYFDDREEGVIDRVAAAGERIMLRCIELGGSLSGEHGIGVEKLDLMEAMFGVEGMRLQTDVHDAFNPNSACNPCKVIPTQKSCVEHRTRWRGAAW